ncbi:MAG: hypothetical protein AAF206_03250 [Bacteroidota bacterium]
MLQLPAVRKSLCPYFSALSFLFISFFFSPKIIAQPIEAWFTPEEMETGDEVNLHVNYGNASLPVSDVTEIQLVIGYEGFAITNQPTPNTGGGWFCADGNCNTLMSVNDDLKEIYIGMTRTDAVPQSGHGFLMKGGGMIVEVIEILKNGPQTRTWLKDIQVKTAPIAAIAVQYIPYQGLQIQADDPGTHSISILNLSGQIIGGGKGQRFTYAGPLSQGQIILIRVLGQKGIRQRKVMIRY